MAKKWSEIKHKKTTDGIVGPNPGDAPLRMPVIQQRYRVTGDNDGHEYFIKVGDEKLFEAWVEMMESYESVGYEGPDFNENRIDGRFTFTDPRNE